MLPCRKPRGIWRASPSENLRKPPETLGNPRKPSETLAGNPDGSAGGNPCSRAESFEEFGVRRHPGASGPPGNHRKPSETPARGRRKPRCPPAAAATAAAQRTTLRAHRHRRHRRHRPLARSLAQLCARPPARPPARQCMSLPRRRYSIALALCITHCMGSASIERHRAPADGC